MELDLMEKGGFHLVTELVETVIFGVDMSSSTKIDNGKDILILGKGHTQGLEQTLTAKKLCSINFTKNNKKICWRLHYNGANRCLFVNGTEKLKFKVKDSEIVDTPLYLWKISKDFWEDNMKKTGLNVYVYDFSGDYNDTAVNDILDINNYLMKKMG